MPSKARQSGVEREEDKPYIGIRVISASASDSVFKLNSLACGFRE